MSGLVQGACDPGEFEIFREETADAIIVYCADRERAERWRQIEARLSELGESIARDQRELARLQGGFTAFASRFEHVLCLTNEEQKKLVRKTMGIALDYYFGKLRERASTEAALTREEAKKLQAATSSELLAQPRLEVELGKSRDAVARMREWESTSNLGALADLLFAVHDVLDGIELADQGKYLEALAEVGSLALKDPRVKLIVGTFDLSLTAAVDAATHVQDLELLESLGTGALSDLDNYVRVLRDHVAERQRLQSERQQILAGSRPG